MASALALVCAVSGYGQGKTATATTFTVSSGGSPASTVASGTVVTLTASVAAGSTTVTPGQVEFCDATAKYCTDIHSLGTAQLTSAGTATLKFRPGMGNHSYKAVFLGTNTYAGSVSAASALAITGTIPPLATSTTINQTGSWGAYTLSASVTETGNTAPPTGLISFLDTNNGNAVLGTGELGAATRGVTWTSVDTSAPNLAGVYYAVADLNGDGIPDLFVKDYFGTYDVLLGNGDGSFSIGESAFGPSSETGSFVIGDFNNDGIPDVAAIGVNYGTTNGTITIFLGNGDGTFTVAASSPALGQGASAIATADINGDGNADLIVSEQSLTGNGEIVILFGNGDGTFTQAPTTVSTNAVAPLIIPADVNGDGKVDLVVPYSSPTETSIYLGNGDGTFTAVADSGVPETEIIAVADFNNDGFPDLILPTTYDGSLTVYLGNGDGTFTEAPKSPESLPTGGFLAVSDVNQDGIADVVYYNGNTTGILLGNGDGTFVQYPETLSFQPYGFGTDFVVADFNGDGWPDVLSIELSGRTIADSLTQPTETATASAAISIAVPGTYLAQASYPGDSNYNSSVSGTVALWGPPPATTTSLIITSGGNEVSSVAPDTAVTLTATVMAESTPVTAGQVNFCDATAAHCTDIHIVGTAALTTNGTASFKFVPGSGTHSYKAEFVQNGLGASSASGAATLTVGPTPAPLYSDTTTITDAGYPGAYSLTATVVGYGGTAAPGGTVSFLDTSEGNASLGTATLGSSTQGIGWLMSQTPALGGDYQAAEVTADFNGDGVPDLAVLWSNSSFGEGNSVTIFLGNSDGSFATGTTIQAPNGQSFSDLVATDLNGDGKVDLVLLSYGFANQDTVTTYLGNGDGTFGAPQTTVVQIPTQNGGDFIPGAMVAGDFNGDGKIDLAVVGNYVSGGITILLGNGDGTFNAAQVNLLPAQAFGYVATGDFNGDGIPDLVVADYYEDLNGMGSATVLMGKGDGTFTPVSTFEMADFPKSIVVGDFNGDGVPDLAFGSEFQGVTDFIGKGDGTFTPAPAETGGAGLSLVAGDFNHDGKLDLAGIDEYNGVIDLFLGNGDGTFTETATTPAVTPQGGNAFAIAAADFNGDGIPDLALLGRNVGTATILLTEPTETATATLNNVAPIGAGTHNAEASYPGDSNYPASVSGTVALSAGLEPLVVTPASGNYFTAQTVTITESVPGATIYYSASGTVNTNGFVAYTGPIVLNEGGSEFIQAYATETGYQQTNYVYLNYAISLPDAPRPVFAPAPGSYAGSQSVTITDVLNGATIYYTTDGTVPTFASAIYSGAITVSSSQTLVATAIGAGYSMSLPAAATYVIDSAATSFIYTIAGDGAYGYSGDGGPATLADLNCPGPAVLDSAGNIYFSDECNNVVREVAAGTGIISTIAGTGMQGYAGDGGAATSAQLNYPWSLAMDATGNLYIADTGNDVIREVASGTGIITTYAGNGSVGVSGNGGPATSAGIGYVSGLATDAAGNLYLSEQNTIRQVAASTGTITTIVGNGSYGFSGDGGPALSAELAEPSGITMDASGNLYIADTANSVIREVSKATGNISTVAGHAVSGQYMGGFSGDGGPATSAQLSWPRGVAVDAAGNLYIADSYNNRIRKVTSSAGIITTVAGDGNECNSQSGDGGPATSATFCVPQGVTVDTAGNLYVADYFGVIHEVTAPANPPTNLAATPAFSVAAGTYSGTQVVTVSDTTPGAEIYITMDGSVATTSAQGYNGPITVNGNATIGAIAAAPGYLPSAAASATYTITTPPSLLIDTVVGSGVRGFSGQGGPGFLAQMAYPTAIALDAAGDIYVADSGNNVVWMSAAKTGIMSIVAGSGNFGYLGDNGPATSAELENPEGIALDSAGNLYIADTYNNRIRKVTASTGMITTVAGNGQLGSPSGQDGDGGSAASAQLNSPDAVVLDASSNLYIADTNDNRVREVTATTGIISTFAGNGSLGASGNGGPATNAAIGSPSALTFDSGGDLYIAAGQVRKVTAGTGIISTVAGNADTGGGTGDGGPALEAEINPDGIAVDSSGNLYIANSPDTIRRVDAQTGVITRYAGNGYTGSYGDGGSATMAALCGPSGPVFDASGNLYFADQCNYRVREISAAIPSPTATPLISLASGTYTSVQSVTITDATPQSVIFYTLDGSTPSTTSTEYTGAIVLSSSETLKAIAMAPGLTESAVATATYIVNLPQTPTLTWATPAPITYGTPLSTTQLDATASVAGTLAYSPAAGTVLPAGQQTLSVTFTPTDNTDYTSVQKSVTLVVNQATPVITWPTPAPILVGTALSSAQLDATASVQGTFVYSPAAGAQPPVGNDTLSVTFTPSDATDYTTATDSVTLAVNPITTAPTPALTSLSPAFVSAGGSAFTLTIDGSGFLSSSTAYWGTAALSTQLVSGTQLTAQVPAADIANAGTASVTVQTTSSGATSNPMVFEIDSASSGSTSPSFTTTSVTVTAGATASFPVTLPSAATDVSASCLNLPAGAACSYSAASGAVTITTSSSTPKGTYQVTVVFTETLPGAAAAVILVPFLLIPLVFYRRRLRRGWLIASLAIVMTVAAIYAAGCGGGGGSTSTPPPPQTHQVTSSGVVSLTVQ